MALAIDVQENGMNLLKLDEGQIRPVDASYKPLSDEELTLVENRFGVLPVDFRRFISIYGCSRFERVAEVTPIGPLPEFFLDGKLPFQLFLGGGDERDSYHLLRALDSYQDRIPAGLLPIARHYGDLYCLDMSGEHGGKIFYWDSASEMNEEEFNDFHEGRVSYDEFHNVYCVAESFSDFINRFSFKDDYD